MADTTLDENEEIMRIKNLIMEELKAHIQCLRSRDEEDKAKREAASNKALSKLSCVVTKNLMEEIMNSCSRWACNKEVFFLYFSSEEGLQAWLKV